MRRTRMLTTAAGVLALALALAGSLSAAPSAKTQLTITMLGKISGLGGPTSGTFDLVGSTAASTDSGTLTFTAPNSLPRKTPEGLTYTPMRLTETLRGKHGTLIIRATVRLYDVVTEDDFVAAGTWSIVKGTGNYAGLSGKGSLVGLTQPSSQATSISEHQFSYRLAGLTSLS